MPRLMGNENISIDEIETIIWNAYETIGFLIDINENMNKL